MADSTLREYVDDTTLSEFLLSTTQERHALPYQQPAYLDCLKFHENRSCTLRPKKCFLVFQSSVSWLLITTQLKEFVGLNSLESTLITIWHGICTLTIFSPELNITCTTLNGLNMLVFLLTDLLFGTSPSSDQSLSIVLLFDTAVWRNVTQKWLGRSRSDLFALSNLWQHLWLSGCCFSTLSSHLFQIAATNSAVTFF